MTNLRRLGRVQIAVVLLSGAVVSLLLIVATIETTPTFHPGEDLRTYQKAGNALYTSGSPYSISVGRPEERQFRYPPLLAILAPVLTIAPLWYALMVIGAAWPFVLAYRTAGPPGVALPIALLGPTLHGLLGGNIQPLTNGMWAAVPFSPRWGPILLATIVWIKVWPVVSILFWIGRGDWRSIYRFTWAAALIGALQLPWLDDWIRYWLTPEAAFTRGGFAIQVLFGPTAWIVATIAVVVIAILAAKARWGWALTIVLHFVADPRWFVPSLSSLVAALPVAPSTPKVAAEERQSPVPDRGVR